MPYDTSLLLRFIRRLGPPHRVREASDGHLLECFVAAKDDVAFEGLMQRHGPMVLLAAQATAAPVPAVLVKSTLKVSLLGTAGKTATVGVVPAQVFSLTKEVTKAMFLTKLRMVTLTIIAVGIIGAGAAGVTYVLGKGGDDPAAVKTTKNTPAGDHKVSKTDQEKIQGTWIVVSYKAWDDKGREIDLGGEKIAQLIKEKKLKMVFSGEKLTFSGGDETPNFKYKLDPSKKPKTIDAIADKEEESLKGIYTLDGKELKLCFAGAEHQASFSPDAKGLPKRQEKVIAGARPKDFSNPPGAELSVCEYEGPAK